MAYFGLWLGRQPWWVRVAFWGFVAACFAIGIVRGAFFYHHDKTLLWFAPVPLALGAYVGYLVWKRPPAEPDDREYRLSRRATWTVGILTLVMIGVLSVVNGPWLLVIPGVLFVVAVGLVANRVWPPPD